MNIKGYFKKTKWVWIISALSLMGLLIYDYADGGDFKDRLQSPQRIHQYEQWKKRYNQELQLKELEKQTKILEEQNYILQEMRDGQERSRRYQEHPTNE